MNERSFRRLFWVLAFLGAGLDQATKYGVFAWLYNEGQGSQYAVAPQCFDLVAHFYRDPEGAGGAVHPQVNHGALFGIFGEHKALANLTFAAVSIAAALAIIYWSSRRATAHDWSLCAALGLILAGTMGNLYDRLVFGGVRDFFHFYYNTFDWPVFNVADCCLVTGAFLLLAQAFLTRHATERPAARDMVMATQTAEAR
jgi:signal peptidase II